MATFTWLPLELWRASALAQETKAVITLYENVANSGDNAALAALRSSIDGRIEDLEAFYSRNSDDERCVLFEKQRLKLRKLLHEYDQYLASIASGAVGDGSGSTAPSSVAPTSTGGMPASPARTGGRPDAASPQRQMSASASSLPGGGAGGVTTRVIREDTRLTLPELSAWFAQAGGDEMPEVTLPVVGRVFASITRTNPDGKLSIRDLRQWYLTFGRHALAAAGRDADASLGGDPSAGGAGGGMGGEGGGGPSSSAPIVTMPVMRSLHVRLATTGTRQLVQQGQGQQGQGGRRGSKDGGKRQLYPWEQRAGAGGSSGGGDSPNAAGASSSSSASSSAAADGRRPSAPAPAVFTSLPNGVLELQVRLSPEEHAAVGRLRRQMAAESRYRSRIADGQARAAAKRGGVLGGSGAAPLFGDKADGSSVAEPYAEPLTRDAATVLTRGS